VSARLTSHGTTKERKRNSTSIEPKFHFCLIRLNASKSERHFWRGGWRERQEFEHSGPGGNAMRVQVEEIKGGDD
jgi:hypothetical protein